jgi:hypothetical protein
MIETLTPAQQVENIRQAVALLNGVMPTGHASYMQTLSGAFDTADLDALEFLDVAMNGTALEMLTFLSIDQSDISEQLLTIAGEEFDQQSDDNERVETWDAVEAY